MGEHIHEYVATELREEELPLNPAYKAGDTVFVCTECRLLQFGNPWVDRSPRYRADGA